MSSDEERCDCKDARRIRWLGGRDVTITQPNDIHNVGASLWSVDVYDRGCHQYLGATITQAIDNAIIGEELHDERRKAEEKQQKQRETEAELQELKRLKGKYE